MAKTTITSFGNYGISGQATAGPGRDYVELSTLTQGAQLAFTVSIVSDAALVQQQSLLGGEMLTDEVIKLFRQYDWNEAPAWALWAAVNSDGSGTWFANKPILNEGKGKWVTDAPEGRNWPMSSTVRLFRSWRYSLCQRPVPATPPTTTTGDPNILDYLPPGSTIVTDVTGYIAVTMGDMQVVPDIDDLVSSSSTTVTPVPTVPLSATVAIEASSDSVVWINVTTLTLTDSIRTAGFSTTGSWKYYRTNTTAIEGTDAFILSSLGVQPTP